MVVLLCLDFQYFAVPYSISLCACYILASEVPRSLPRHPIVAVSSKVLLVPISLVTMSPLMLAKFINLFLTLNFFLFLLLVLCN